MPNEHTSYSCSVCKAKYKEWAQAVKCEDNHLDLCGSEPNFEQKYEKKKFFPKEVRVTATDANGDEQTAVYIRRNW